LVWNFTEVGWHMTGDVDRLLTVPASSLRKIGEGYMIQCPDEVVIDRFVPILQFNPNVDAVCQQAILAVQVSAFDFFVEGGIVPLED